MCYCRLVSVIRDTLFYAHSFQCMFVLMYDGKMLLKYLSVSLYKVLSRRLTDLEEKCKFVQIFLCMSLFKLE